MGFHGNAIHCAYWKMLSTAMFQSRMRGPNTDVSFGRKGAAIFLIPLLRKRFDRVRIEE